MEVLMVGLTCGAFIGWLAEKIMEMIFYLSIIMIGVMLMISGGVAIKGISLELKGATEEEYKEFVEEVAGKQD
jgi:hypothetical protein